MNHTLKLAVLAFAIAGIGSVAQAEVVGGVSHSDPGGVRVGASTYPLNDQGKPGAGVDGQLRGAYASTSHFANPEYRDGNGVYSYSGRLLVSRGAPGPGQRGDHSKLGVWSFSQVGSHDIWFGEWNAESPTGAVGTKAPGTHTVWYVGENSDVASTLPTGSPVRYTIRSINNYTGNDLPTSTLTANFATGAASSRGDIGFSGGAIKTVDRDVRLTASRVTVASSGGTGGDLEGKFFGTGAAAVAGVVKFADRNRDTAFGGTKNR
ncbi:Slam-dependent surface lipoprotein [Allopusillimonas ginsengisoli]|uniref:Slam-dependent surface lipoprotein n=1 Tax=Allopusillimonas ginsengisoli TaxID=453575 RepID=UPI00101F5EDF|nr:Slam-dependent surface lipoprotein [Allopusillimonas ginsengisoli]TEA78866.1 hypothetical protein ERE07_05545 [Allopusillimonas ginsengisoli]